MGARLFLPESRLEEWIADGRAELVGANLRLPTERSLLALESATHILGLVDGRDDAGIVGKVKTESQLRELGAEILGTTILLGETAYETIPGFLLVTKEGELDETRTFLEAEG